MKWTMKGNSALAKMIEVREFKLYRCLIAVAVVPL